MYWYYTSFNQRRGPFAIEDLHQRFLSGELPPEMPVFSEAMGNWYPLGKLFHVTNIDEPAPVRREKELDIPPAAEDEGVVVRPWVRFFARMTDYFLFAFFTGFILGLLRIAIVTTSISVVVFSASLTFLWSFIEAGFLCACHTTPGKALFGIHVKKKNGERLTYKEALARAFSVWLVGMGCALPLVVFITLIVACVKLSNNHITSWDERGDILVQHQKLKWWKIGIVGIIYMVILGLFFSA